LFLGQIFHPDHHSLSPQKKKSHCDLYKDFLKGKMAPSCHIMRKKNLKPPDLDNRFQHFAKINIGGFLDFILFLVSFMTCSQIWPKSSCGCSSDYLISQNCF
jgi:hypothetical protein